MEREACVCDHGFERSDLCAEIIIIIIIIIITRDLTLSATEQNNKESISRFQTHQIRKTRGTEILLLI